MQNYDKPETIPKIIVVTELIIILCYAQLPLTMFVLTRSKYSNRTVTA